MAASAAFVFTAVATLALLLPVWVPVLAAGLPSLQTAAPTYELSFYNTHTQETLTVNYRRAGYYHQAALTQVNQLLRDHRNGHVHKIDSRLLDLLYDLKRDIQARHPGVEVKYQIISGYRSPETNESLRRAGGGQARRSEHINGKAIDIRVPGVPLKEVRTTAWCLQRGGVGYYGGSDFVHVDTGKIRHWNWSPSGLKCPL